VLEVGKVAAAVVIRGPAARPDDTNASVIEQQR